MHAPRDRPWPAPAPTLWRQSIPGRSTSARYSVPNATSRRSRPSPRACRRSDRAARRSPLRCRRRKCRSRRESSSEASSACRSEPPPCAFAGQKPAATSVSFSVWNDSPCVISSRRTALWLDSEPLCTRHWSAPVVKGWAPSVVTADFGRHAGMADGVRAAHRAEAELPRHIVGTSHFLENLHPAAGPDDGDLLKGGQCPPRRAQPVRPG